MGFWSVSREKKLKEMWSQGYSAQLIANDIGCSRNAVIGKAHRLGISEKQRITRHTANNTIYSRNAPKREEKSKYRKAIDFMSCGLYHKAAILFMDEMNSSKLHDVRVAASHKFLDAVFMDASLKY